MLGKPAQAHVHAGVFVTCWLAAVLALAAEHQRDDVDSLERQFMHPRSGCTIAHATYDIKGECAAFSPAAFAPHALKCGDTVYVPVDSVVTFVTKTLPSVAVPIILLTGKHELIRNLSEAAGSVGAASTFV